MTAETTGGAVGHRHGGRMSRRCKRGAVLRPLRGEDLEMVSRALDVTAATLSGWRDAFLAAGEEGVDAPRMWNTQRRHQRERAEQRCKQMYAGSIKPALRRSPSTSQMLRASGTTAGICFT